MLATEVLGVVLLLTIAALAATLPIVLELRLVIHHAVGGIGEVLVTQLLVTQGLLLLTLGTVWFARTTPGVLSGWWFVALTTAALLSAVMLVVRWRCWRRDDGGT